MPISDQDIYEQDAEFCRYQDNLRWSRFQTAALVEAAIAYAIWGTDKGIGSITCVLLSLGGAVLILLLWALSQIDESDYASHLARITDQEKQCPQFLFKRVPARLVSRRLKGSLLMPMAWSVLCAFNLVLIIRSIVGSNF